MEQLLEPSDVETQQISTQSTPKLKKVSKREQEAELLQTQKMEVIAALMRGSNVADATKEVGVDRSTFYLWSKTDSAFVAELNRQKSEHAQTLRNQIRDLVPEAIKTMRDLLTNTETPAVVRLKTAMTILESACSLKPENFGSLDAEEIQQMRDNQELMRNDPSFKYLNLTTFLRTRVKHTKEPVEGGIKCSN
ncbi:MAG: helix-turn-helix domain-containing protein [Acidobacteriaceae bacterium]|nr:helix-turn-helix domain-containing protein [Acidobacteriaceae bacterium]